MAFSNASPTLILLKLGGSLITDKTRPHTPRPEVLTRLAREIAAAQAEYPEIQLIIGHGSGSFGHVPAKKYATRQGVNSPEGWRGFVEVWREANALNRLVMDALGEVGLPVMAFPPAAAVIAQGGQVNSWDFAPLRAALSHGIIPIIQGDTIFDSALGGTILSTEDLFDPLARALRPQRILLAGIEPGVWADFPACTRLIEVISPANLGQVALAGSAATDVTGGMASKVKQSLELAQAVPGLEVVIFSGEQAGVLQAVLGGSSYGTHIYGMPIP
jgi:isopentenyl phosphate kinase